MRRRVRQTGPSPTRYLQDGQGSSAHGLVASSRLHFELWLEFEEWISPPDEDPADDFFNMQIKLLNGTCYALNVWTYDFFERARREAAAAPEMLNGRYLEPPDLFVERMERSLLEQVVADLIANGGLRDSWLVPPQDLDAHESV